VQIGENFAAGLKSFFSALAAAASCTACDPISHTVSG